MKLAYYIKEEKLALIPGIPDLTGKIRATGAELYRVKFPEDVVPGTDALLSLGGDGTFLSAARIAVPSGLPVLGVNFGRLGFLSDMEPGALVDALQKWEFVTEERDLLRAGASFVDDADFWPYALNEVSVSRTGASMLGIDVSVDGVSLPTYWADGLLVATGTGSTAYSMSAGGPIVEPTSHSIIVTPVCAHQLAARAMVLSDRRVVTIQPPKGNRKQSYLSVDGGKALRLMGGERVEIRRSEHTTKLVRLSERSFYQIINQKLGGYAP